jgi:RHS repeat-associated protein
MAVGSQPFIRYNVLNLPDTIQFGNGRQIINSYDAGGHKLTTQYYTPIGTVIVTQGNIHGSYTTANSILLLDDYCGSYLYENGTSAGVHPLTKILTPEGYIDMSTSGYPYCYYKQDHLGSNREVTSYAGTTGTVVQQTEYYPSGTAYVEGTGAGIQPFKFTGKELITMHGLNWQDFGARWLDNVRMQWTTMDPLCEKYYGVSPYAYCAGNPVKYLDPSGGRLVDANGNLMYTQIGGWTKYATEDAKRIGNDMMRTETGNNQWNKMANAPYSITTTLSSEDRTIDKGNGIKERHFGDSFINVTINSVLEKK